MIPVWIALGACAVAGYSDVRTRRIPNWLTGSLAVAALVVHGVEGLWPLAISAAIMVITAALGTLVYARGGIGGGDIKLAIAASGMLSYPLCVPFLLYTMIAGGLLALLVMISCGMPKALFSRLVFATIGGIKPGIPLKTQTMPYAIAFAAGATMVALSQSAVPFLRISL